MDQISTGSLSLDYATLCLFSTFIYWIYTEWKVFHPVEKNFGFWNHKLKQRPIASLINKIMCLKITHTHLSSIKLKINEINMFLSRL